MVINPQSDMNILDICQIPCNEGDTPYFILHTGRGILIVNTAKCRSYELAYNEQTNELNRGQIGIFAQDRFQEMSYEEKQLKERKLNLIVRKAEDAKAIEPN